MSLGASLDRNFTGRSGSDDTIVAGLWRGTGGIPNPTKGGMGEAVRATDVVDVESAQPDTLGRSNGSHDKLCGRWPRAEAERRGGCREARPKRQYAICNRRDAAVLGLRQPARPADRSRAAPASS